MAIFVGDKQDHEKLLRKQSSKKVKWLQERIESFGQLPNELLAFPDLLQEVSILLEERNLIIHGRIYALPGQGDVRYSSRSDISRKPATSLELYELANAMFAVEGPLQFALQFAIPRLLNSKGSHDRRN